jgi:hypothetical protein
MNNIMKTKIEIKSILGKVLFTYEAENATIKDAVEQAVKEKVSLNSADLRSANLSSADLRSADLSSADLRWANLRSANLRSADLRRADLRWANLRSADLSSADLSSANLSSAKNKETAYLPLFCKWSFSILGDKIQIGCEKRTIKEWDLFFNSEETLSTQRGTDEFKQIEAVYLACKAYLTKLSE